MNKANFSRSKVWFVLLGLLLAVLLVLLVLTALGKTPQRKEKAQEGTSAAATETPEEGLKTNAYPKVNALIEKYYSAQTHSNTETLKEIVVPFEDTDETTVARKSTFVESYENINCYTEDGVDEGTYIVFACYDIKFPNVDTMAPGLETLIVCTNEDGELYINNDSSTLSDTMTTQLSELASRADVVALVDDVETSFAEIVQSDENVKSLCEQMGMDVSSLTASASETPATEDPAATTAPVGEVNKEMMAVQDLEIYASAEEGDVIGTVTVGSLVWTVENLSGGFSSIQTDDINGYVKTTGIANYTLVDQEISATANYYSSCAATTAAGTINSDGTYYCTLSLDNGWSQLLVDDTKVYVKTADIGLDEAASDTSDDTSSDVSEDTAAEDTSEEDTSEETTNEAEE